MGERCSCDADSSLEAVASLEFVSCKSCMKEMSNVNTSKPAAVDEVIHFLRDVRKNWCEVF